MKAPRCNNNNNLDPIISLESGNRTLLEYFSLIFDLRITEKARENRIFPRNIGKLLTDRM